MNKFIKVAQNRATHTIDELRTNHTDCMAANFDLFGLTYEIANLAYLERCMSDKGLNKFSQMASVKCDRLITESFSEY